MPRTKKIARTAPSSELGEGNWAIDFNQNGRAVRKCRTQARASPFQDSAVAISDPEDDDLDDDDDADEVVKVASSRKRKRSPSPDLPLPSDVPHLRSHSDSDSSDTEHTETPTPALAGHTTLHLTVNIPLGHQGPITLHLDPNNFPTSYRTPSFAKPDRLTQATLARLTARSKSRSSTRAGFLDLPAELRNDIYRMVFVGERKVNFSNPDNFSRTAALLRSCRQVYEEGRSILYSENTFAIERRTQRYGSLWENEWRELGYLAARKFMKTIGPTNLALIRHVSMMLEDAVPCLNPTMETNEERRFVYDNDLISVLRHLGNHGQLQTLDLHFHGRRRVARTDDRFLDYMKRIKADAVHFLAWPPGATWTRESKEEDAVRSMLLSACTRRRKKFD
ncbi:Hypothetical predicted protein [Lecanosticta acicola]|uniref:Uncharacterized protein n=1 Tax=Lecanosticta acicola TaxID=111012 RepID=A0AAI8YZP8_9PEZI|nr:Hypothetical predicted protein [Lecanosticta acicola]